MDGVSPPGALGTLPLLGPWSRCLGPTWALECQVPLPCGPLGAEFLLYMERRHHGAPGRYTASGQKTMSVSTGLPPGGATLPRDPGPFAGLRCNGQLPGRGSKFPPSQLRLLGRYWDGVER